MKNIKITISDDAYARLRDFPERPRAQWGKRNTPEFYGNVFLTAMDSDGFKLKEAQERIRGLEARVKQLQSRNSALEWRLKRAQSK